MQHLPVRVLRGGLQRQRCSVFPPGTALAAMLEAMATLVGGVPQRRPARDDAGGCGLAVAAR